MCEITKIMHKFIYTENMFRIFGTNAEPHQTMLRFICSEFTKWFGNISDHVRSINCSKDMSIFSYIKEKAPDHWGQSGFCIDALLSEQEIGKNTGKNYTSHEDNPLGPTSQMLSD